MSQSAFGFKVDDEKSSGYIAEKLRITGDTTREKFADLINGVIRELLKSEW